MNTNKVVRKHEKKFDRDLYKLQFEIFKSLGIKTKRRKKVNNEEGD